MNTVNRTIVTAAAAAVLMAATAALLVTMGLVDYRFPPWIPDTGWYTHPQLVESEDGTPAEDASALPLLVLRPDVFLEPELRHLSHLGFQDRAMAILATLAVMGAMAILISLQTPRKGGSNRPGLLVSDTEIGTSTVNRESVRMLAEVAGATDGQINQVNCRIRQKKNAPPGGPDRIEIVCIPHLKMGASLERVRDHLQERVKDTVEKSTGLVVERVHVSGARFDPLPKSRLLESPDREA